MARNGKRLGFLPDWRIFTYVILAVNLIFLIWIIAGASSSNDTSAKNCGGLSAKTCNDAQNVGKGIGVALIIVLWVIVDIILGILWLITNRKKRECPVCGHDVKKGVTQCRNCGYDFRAQHQQPGYPNGYQPQPPYPPQPSPGQAPQGQWGPPPQQAGEHRPGPGR